MGRKGQTKYNVQIGDVIGYNTITNINERNVTIQCECGSAPRVVDIWYVAASKNRRCSECGNRRYGKSNPSFAGYEDIRGNWPVYLNKRNAVLGFGDSDVDFPYLWQMFLTQDRKCALTGLEITFHGVRGKHGFERTASLDRIDSTMGYFKGNIQWVHKHINHMKNKYDQQYFVYLCELVSKKHSSTYVNSNK